MRDASARSGTTPARSTPLVLGDGLGRRLGGGRRRSNTLWRISRRCRIRPTWPCCPAAVRDHRGGGRVVVFRPAWWQTYTSSPCPPTSSSAATVPVRDHLPGGPETPAWAPEAGVAGQSATGGRESCRRLLGRHQPGAGQRGEIYVAELFGGRISVIRTGERGPTSPPGVVAVETSSPGALGGHARQRGSPAGDDRQDQQRKAKTGSIVAEGGGYCARSTAPAKLTGSWISSPRSTVTRTRFRELNGMAKP